MTSPSSSPRLSCGCWTSRKPRGIPYPDDIFAWREANAAAIAALEVRAEPAVREAEAGP